MIGCHRDHMSREPVPTVSKSCWWQCSHCVCGGWGGGVQSECDPSLNNGPGLFACMWQLDAKSHCYAAHINGTATIKGLNTYLSCCLRHWTPQHRGIVPWSLCRNQHLQDCWSSVSPAQGGKERRWCLHSRAHRVEGRSIIRSQSVCCFSFHYCIGGSETAAGKYQVPSSAWQGYAVAELYISHDWMDRSTNPLTG